MIRGIRRPATFASLRTHGQRVRRRGIAVVYLPLTSPDTEVAYAISRRAANAVRRNRCRRRLRSALVDLQNANDLPAGAYLISVSADAVDASQAELHAVLHQLVSHLSERAP